MDRLNILEITKVVSIINIISIISIMVANVANKEEDLIHLTYSSAQQVLDQTQMELL
jgi:hypothetical protein